MQGSKIKRALASCWRVFLLLLLAIPLLAAWLYWQAPKLDELRPLVVSHLEQQLQLERVELGELSWHWAGFLWLEADRLSFTSRDKSISFDGGRVAVRIPFATVLSGNIVPESIRLSNGRLEIVLDGAATPIPAEQLLLDDVSVGWRYKDWQGELPRLHLALDGPGKRLKLTSPALELTGWLDDDELPREFKLHAGNTDWLPEAVLTRLAGAPTLDLSLRRLGKRQWQMTLQAESHNAVSIRLAETFALEWSRLYAEIELTTRGQDDLTPERIDFRQLEWSLAESAITATGGWQDGTLTLHAASNHLAMPVMWSWLHPLDDDPAWQKWLSLMQAGTASNAVADLSLAWPEPWREVPSSEALYAMKYAVTGDVEEADIALGIGDDFMLHTRAHVELNEEGLHAAIAEGVLPRQLGSTTGELLIPWNTLDLYINGTARASMAALMRWFGPKELEGWQWNGAQADADFRFLWDPSKEEPNEAEVTLRPIENWHVTVSEIPLQATGGSIYWDQEEGLRLETMNVGGAHMQGVLSLAAVQDEFRRWSITSLDGKGAGNFTTIAGHFQLPLSNARGKLSGTLRYNGQWSGQVDMSQTGWDRLLGSSKKIGDPFIIHYQGELEANRLPPTINLSRLKTRGQALQLAQGRASLNRHGISLHLENLQTPAFRGSLDIALPFGNKPWEIEASASYLNRTALPESLNHPDQLIDKAWVLRARIDQFDWSEARMSDVIMQLSSIPGNVGMFEAQRIHATQLEMQNVNAQFSLPGEGEVDLRHFSADIEKQHLLMSARLTPEEEGGMRWHGFAELTGDFGHLMKQGNISQRFLGGRGHVLFSGQGIMLREQPWWQGLDGRLRLRADNGYILEGGTLSTLLAATSLTDLPRLLIGQRKDLTGPGIMFKRLQMEAIMQDRNIDIRNIAMRSTAFDVVGYGGMDIADNTIDLYLILKPLQNLDAVLSKIPLLRDVLGGQARSLMRKVYHMHGPFTDAKVEAIRPEEIGLKRAGIVEHLLNLPNLWFGQEKPEAIKEPAAAEPANP